MKKIVLASSSPRRSGLLQKLGIPFVVDVSDFDEQGIHIGDPVQFVKAVALGKAKKVAARHPHALVIGADTMVVHEGSLVGKPKDAKHARSMLSQLNGRAHTVLTGVAVYDTDTHSFWTDAREARVYFKEISDAEITALVKSGEPFGKAGGYDIRGLASFLVEKIEGDKNTVIGLPLEPLRWRLATLGVPVSLESV